MSKITERVTQIVRPHVEAEGCELWDVEYVREAGTWYLRVLIDKEGGVSIDDCERISRRIDPVLDEEDPIPGSYVFEVGSAGADRELKRPGDFERFMGRAVEVKLYQPVEGSKSFTGRLCGYADGRVSIDGGKSVRSFEKGQVAQVRLHVTIDEGV